MNKIELIEALRENNDLSRSEAIQVVELFFGSIADTLAKGERVEIRDLCSFIVKSYESYAGRNPKTGEIVQVKPKKLPSFRPGLELKSRVDR